MKEIVYLNGKFLTKGRAKISPEDRGFNFADGVYEVVKFYGGKPFRWDEHFLRLKRSLDETGITYSRLHEVRDFCFELIDLNRLNKKDAAIYLQVTRGTHKRVHHFPEGIEPTVYATAFEMPSFSEKLEKGIKVITQEDIRWLRCDIKSISLLPNTMLYNKAVQAGAGESILIRDGILTEATHSSVLGIKNGAVVTHPLSRIILPGITRIVVSEICTSLKIPFTEMQVPESEIYQLDEMFIAGTGSEIMPVVQVNDVKIGNGEPGPVTKMIQKEFFRRTSEL
jgi:D-alanine transaminase